MKQLDPKAVWYFFINNVVSLSMALLTMSFIVAPTLLLIDGGEAISFLAWSWVLIPVVIVWGFIWAKLTYHFYRYELVDAGFRKESGVISKKYVTIPYERIQNVDIYRGIWARILGLSDLSIQTAGASSVVVGRNVVGVGAEGQLPGLSREIAEQLRDELIQRARQSKNQGL